MSGPLFVGSNGSWSLFEVNDLIAWIAGFLIAMIQKGSVTYDLRLSARWLSDRRTPSCLG